MRTENWFLTNGKERNMIEKDKTLKRRVGCGISQRGIQDG